MIRIENDNFYMSAGEACYIFKIENGIPMHVYFGKRVEPEDDLGALGFFAGTPELSVPTAVIDDEEVDTEFVFETAGVNNDGENKTLIVELRDKKNHLKAHMYYTPHPRGGIFRRVVLESSSGYVKFPLVRQALSCGFSDSIVENNGKNACYGFLDSHGFLCANADGNVTIKRDGNEAVVTLTNNEELIVSGGIYEVDCPELLCVYSDNGKGGISRVFHDILREQTDGGDLSERSAVLFLPKIDDFATLKAAVKVASELGFGVVALDGGKHTKEMMDALCGVCRENGLIPGLRINRDAIEPRSALYTNWCKKAANGEYKYDYSDKHTAGLYHAVRAEVARNDIRYVMIDAPYDVSDIYVAHGKFALKNMLKGEHDDVRVDFGMKSDEQSKAFAVCYPLEVVRNIISPEPTDDFKTRFDNASFGTLGYELDPLELSDGVKRAVRAQILAYQDDALTVLHGDIYNSAGCNMAVSKDKSRAYAVCNADGASRVKFNGLDEHNLYHVRELDKTFSGAALVNCGVSLEKNGTYVFHIRQVVDY
ncbi:MAG: GH36 C-terminal domain-containing protein [Clostridiales bacterium]|nr:GH36 C-terminal domain-containing protein [Clostridiales bacterium]